MRKTFPELHKQLWLWLAKNPKCKKRDHAMWKEMCTDDIPTDYCFACKEAVIRRGEDGKTASTQRCHYCPIHKLIPGESTACLDGLYAEYLHEENLILRSSFAFKIANLPWR